MPRTFEMSADSPNTSERILTAFESEKYWRARLLAFADGRPTLESLVTDAHGVTTVTMTLHFGVEQLPPPMNLLPGGNLRVVQVEEWHAADQGALDGAITVTAPGAPVSGDGVIKVVPLAAGGSRLSGAGRVDVRVPLIGGAIASVVAKQLASGIRDIHAFTDAWIANDDGG